MKKQSSRRIPYRVYKKLFADCEAHDYSKGTIVVEFPHDYLTSKFYIPEGWTSGANYISHYLGKTKSGLQVYEEIMYFSDGGCKYYDAYVTVGNVFLGGTQHSKQYIRSFDAALDWVKNKAAEYIA